MKYSDIVKIQKYCINDNSTLNSLSKEHSLKRGLLQYCALVLMRDWSCLAFESEEPREHYDDQNCMISEKMQYQFIRKKISSCQMKNLVHVLYTCIDVCGQNFQIQALKNGILRCLKRLNS